MFTIDAEIEAARPAMRAFCAQLAAAGPLLPPFDTLEKVAATRAAGVPQLIRDAATVLPVEERVVPGRSGDIPVRIVRPSSPPAAVYVDFHGGGFCIGWAIQHDVANAKLARDAGVACVSVDYRLAPEHPFPAGPEDCVDAARWVIENAQREFGCSRIIVGGDSAGGNLALLTAVALRDEGLAHAVIGMHLVYGVFDLSMTPSSRVAVETLVINRDDAKMFNGYYAPGASPEQLRDPRYSPLYSAAAGLAPALLLVGDADPLLDDSLFAFARFQAAGVDAELLVFPEAPHGFVSFPTAYAEIAHRRTVAWIGRRIAATG